MRREQKIDWVTLGLFFALMLLGWLNLYFTPSDGGENSGIFTLSEDHGKQLLFIMVSLLLGILVMAVDTKFLEVISYVIYGLALIALVAVLFVVRTKGAASWFEIAGFKIQPTEFAKLGTAMAMAKYMSRFNFSMNNRRDFLIVAGIVSLPALLVLAQNDAGSFLTFVAFALVLYREGLHPLLLISAILLGTVGFFSVMFQMKPMAIYIIEAVIIGVTLVSFFFVLKRFLGIHLLVALVLSGVAFAGSKVLKEHQTRRIRVLIATKKDLEADKTMKKKEYFNLRMGLVAIGAGRLWGKGWGQATHTKGNHVPEEHTDYIFCVWSEEHGFAGGLVILGLFTALMARIQRLAENSKTDYARVFGYCLFSLLFIHIIINVGMTLGLVPAVGIPLPFMSYGGSSYLAFSMMIFIMINHYSYRVNILR